MQETAHGLSSEFINFVLLRYFSVSLFMKLKGSSNVISVHSFSMKICRILRGEAA